MIRTGAASVRGRLPLASFFLVACGAVIALVPALDTGLALDRAALARGELWRLLTGHLVHDGARLAALDLLVLLLLGAWLERGSRRLLLRALLASALVAGGGVFFLTDYARYVGSSALSSGLLMACVLHVLRTRDGRGPRRLAWCFLALFAAKLLLEAFGTWPAALGGLPPGVEVAGEAHLLGALGGAGAALTGRSQAPPSAA